jgi:hypothetical protein
MDSVQFLPPAADFDRGPPADIKSVTIRPAGHVGFGTTPGRIRAGLTTPGPA